MTLRTKELSGQAHDSRFSKELFSQLGDIRSVVDLSGEGSLFKLTHPALIKCRYYYGQAPQELHFKSMCQHWYISSYKSHSEAQAKHPQVKTYSGFPCHIFTFLSESPTEALINFKELGSIYLSTHHTTTTDTADLQLHHYELPIWLDYALSTELWGPTGKWPRFHQRLHTQFEKYGLLIGVDLPGFYPLKLEAKWLLDYGYEGKLAENCFQLTFPWDFPLTGLIELEKVLARGP